ncbi:MULTISPECIES: winged helix DNA-binding domain-containing protein [unclassified Streptomyces]|uniref:winged helix DNA-binding domain-containing protein n=1 Tax=unclassified Streptomyces TaxID=2593676 RepID=UPI002DD7AFC6|nr:MULTISPECIES: winged helix DNA-binding domain-containing protein [unclassified Streptomyces]WSC47086.1 winged helix DNA-binding domain-containing protein [Streptomyces sp. NBC_01762]WSC53928.1 winged helix DNA-binding domain-containing protein [Streptomyces sp. NBC_01761]WSD26740.1 winged helix DNA-binding domain-containing protein [Streptomyces sp. NBC_01751]WSF84766.1 winged helix DNA-binding domain-containing protein [Streptomyces sp. NBC_01744]
MTTRTATVTWARANARRIERQGLAAPMTSSPDRAVAAMPAAHAQVSSAAELSVGLRLAGATRTDVRKALWNDRTLVRTYGPRGTVHLLTAAELPLWTGALSAIPAGTGPFRKDVRLSADQTEEVLAAVGDALTGAELTIDELSDAVVARTGPWAADRVIPAFQGMWPRWRQVMHLAGHRGVLCFAPDRGRKVTYTNPGATPLDGPEALAGLVHRYLYAYGPATPQHFAKWLAAPNSWAVSVFAEQAGAGAIEEVADEGGGPAWLVTGDTDFPAGPARGVRLLPYFDAFAIASQPRERLFPGAAYTRALAGGQAGNHPVLLIDGTVAGVWHQRRSGRRIAVTVEPLSPLTAGQLRELEEQVERVGVVLEGKPELTVGKVTVGPHA